MRQGIILIILMTIISSCKKEDLQLFVQGDVIDPNQMISVAGAQVVLSGKELSGGTFNNNFNTIASTTTNQNGHFEFYFERKTIAQYKIQVSKGDYFDKTVLITGDAVQPDAPYDLDIEFIPKAYYHLRLENSNPVDDMDRITYRNTNADLACDCCSNQSLTLMGDAVDTSFTCVHEGNKWLRYFYEVERNSNTNSFIDSIYLPPFDTTMNHIAY